MYTCYPSIGFLSPSKANLIQDLLTSCFMLNTKYHIKYYKELSN